MLDYFQKNDKIEAPVEEKSFFTSSAFVSKVIPLLFVGGLFYLFLTRGVIVALSTFGLLIIGFFSLSLLFWLFQRIRRTK